MDDVGFPLLTAMVAVPAAGALIVGLVPARRGLDLSKLLGVLFSVPLLVILGCHELGHFLTCRRYGVPSTAPYFLPAPVGIGTFGAFIRIRSKKWMSRS